MKKLLLLIAVVSLSVTAMSQKGKVTSALSYIDQGILDKAKEAIDQALVNEKSKDWFNTYFAKGKLCQASFESENPKYKTLYPDPLEEAYTSYEKAIELDQKGTTKKKIITNMIYNSLAVNLFNQGSTRFENKDFTGALKSFDIQIKITESDKYVGSLDTGMYYNAALAAINTKKYHDAIKYLEKCTEMKYLGIRPYFDIQACYLGLGDTLKAESILKNLTTSFPNEKDIYFQLIDLYIKSNQDQEALKYIKIAKEQDPINYILFHVSGSIYLKQNNYDFAITDLLKSIELKPDYFDSQLSLGIAFINKAADLNTRANEIMDIKKYNEAVDQLNEVYAKALPFIEKAYELNPEDIYTMSRLQELYYRLKAKDSSLTQKYLNIKTKIDASEKK
jgi:tetratricopeptide (TPR) repeat protein